MKKELSQNVFCFKSECKNGRFYPASRSCTCYSEPVDVTEALQFMSPLGQRLLHGSDSFRWKSLANVLDSLYIMIINIKNLHLSLLI